MNPRTACLVAVVLPLVACGGGIGRPMAGDPCMTTAQFSGTFEACDGPSAALTCVSEGGYGEGTLRSFPCKGARGCTTYVLNGGGIGCDVSGNEPGDACPPFMADLGSKDQCGSNGTIEMTCAGAEYPSQSGAWTLIQTCASGTQCVLGKCG